MIEITGLSKEFQTFKKNPGILGTLNSFFHREWQSKTALDEVSALIQPGELVGLLGANGAGKTTLVKILSGIVHPTRGEVKVMGETPWKRSRSFRSNISLVMGQKAQLWWDLTPMDSFELLKEIYRIPNTEYKKNLSELREWLSVGDQVLTPVRRLSLGERMKMELIAALLHNPQVIFLDEPTIGLDINAQSAMREFLLVYRKERKPIILLTSHYMKDIETLCERIILIHKGKFIYDGSLQKAVHQLNAQRTLTLELENDIPNHELDSLRSAYSDISIPPHTGKTLRVLLPREKARDYSLLFLQKFQTTDFTLVDEEIGETLGRWMKKGGEFL